MSRRVVAFNTEDLQQGKKVELDTYFDRVVKYIPSDVVAAWVTVKGMTEAAKGGVDPVKVLWVAFLFGVAFTLAWTWKQTHQPGKTPAVKQIIISAAAFVVWVIALGLPFQFPPLIGSLLLIAFTLAAALVDP